MKKLIFSSVLAMLLSTPAFASGHSQCMKCHEDDEFTGMSVDAIVADARDSSISTHKKLAELTDEQLQAIATELAGG